MPVYAFRAVLAHGGKAYDTWVSVDASYGGFALFGRLDALEDTPAVGDQFPPVLSPEEAEPLAREGLVRYVLRKRGAKPSIEAIEESVLFHIPVWVLYFRRMGGKIDFAILDGYTGDPMGGRMRQAIINGMVARRQSRQQDPSQSATA